MDRASVGVIFVSFHSDELIALQARRLRSAGFPVVVADNGGTFREPDLESFDTGANLGFGAASNRAVERLGPAVGTICLHNPDLMIEPEGIDRLVDELHAQATAGVVSPAEVQGDLLRANGYRYPSAQRELILGARAWMSGTRVQSPEARAVLAPSDRGAALEHGRGYRRVASGRGRRFGGGGLWVVSREAFETVGGFDESYFLYGEDLDLWHRLVLAGRDAEVCAEVEAYHQPATGSAMGSASREILRWLGVERFSEKFGVAREWQRMHRVHRVLLPAYSRRSPALAGCVAQQWARGSDPVETQRAVRHHLEPRRACHPA